MKLFALAALWWVFQAVKFILLVLWEMSFGHLLRKWKLLVLVLLPFAVLFVIWWVSGGRYI